MSSNLDLIYDTKRKMLAKYPRFGSEIATAKIEFRDNLKYHTAATDGKNIFIDPNYFESLSDDERLFLLAHEIMHKKFMHMFRLQDKNGEMRDLDLWNQATDAIINANLERDGFTIKEGYVNRPEALNYTADEFYEILLKEKQEKEAEEKEQGQNQDNDNQNSNEEKSESKENRDKEGTTKQQNSKENQEEQEQKDESPENYGDDHSMWEEAFKHQNSKEGQKDGKNSEEGKGGQVVSVDETGMDFDEREEFEGNRKEKRERFIARRKKIERDVRGKQGEETRLGDIGESKEPIDWKVLIRREIEKTETIWSQRRSIAENNYAYRLEENDVEDEAETEIMIDVSGSVSLNLVKAFLRQIKPLLEQSKLRVGCFNEKFWGFVDIKSKKDIENFVIPKGARGSSAWTEDWDLAVRSFTKKREINKIVFTDGWPCPGTMPKEDLKGENVIWLVYGNRDFAPCCGKVINISQKQLKRLQQVSKDSSREDESR